MARLQRALHAQRGLGGLGVPRRKGVADTHLDVTAPQVHCWRVAKLRDIRSYGHPLLLIALYAALEGVTILWTAWVPGDPSYADSGNGSLGLAVFISVVLVIFLGLGSRLAWWLAIFFCVLGVGVSLGMAIVGT